jgi:hypothetical protein
MCVRIDPTNPKLFMQHCGKGIVTVILCHQEERIWNVQIDGGDRKSLNENQECNWNPRENGNRCVSSKFNRLYALIENTKADCIDLMMQVSTGND